MESTESGSLRESSKTTEANAVDQLVLSSPEKESRKLRLTPDHIQELEKAFDENKDLDLNGRRILAEKLNLPIRQVAVWFSNRKARFRARKVELEYDSLKASHDALMADYTEVKSDYDLLKCDYKDLLSDNSALCEEVDFLRAKLGGPQMVDDKCPPISPALNSQLLATYESKESEFSNPLAESGVKMPLCGDEFSNEEGRHLPQTFEFNASLSKSRCLQPFPGKGLNPESEEPSFVNGSRNFSFSSVRSEQSVASNLHGQSPVKNRKKACARVRPSPRLEATAHSAGCSQPMMGNLNIDKLPDLVELPGGNSRSSANNTSVGNAWESISDANAGSFGVEFGGIPGSSEPFWWSNN